MNLVSGFTFIKNGLTLGYPVKESVESIEPICDEIVINVGFEDQACTKDDGTHSYLRDYFTHPKFKFVKSWWDPAKTKGGEILAEQTNIALSHCTGRLCQYIQGDESLHEEDLPALHEALLGLYKDPNIDGLVYDYVHFYGNVDIVKQTRTSYRREVRAIKNHKGIKSWKDAQGFRGAQDQKLYCRRVNAKIYHYGWARQESVMRDKVRAFDKFYHGADYESQAFKYERIWGLKKFQGRHPQIMKEWIEKNKNSLDIMGLPLRQEWKNVGLCLTDTIEGLTGYRLGEYKNYKLI